MPKTFNKFQDLKFNNATEYQDLKSYVQYKVKYSNAKRFEYQINQKLKLEGLIKGSVVPYERQKAYILKDLASKRDPAHIMKRMLERYITDGEVQSYIDKAIVEISQFKDTRRVYYLTQGVMVLTRTSDYGKVELTNFLIEVSDKWIFNVNGYTLTQELLTL